MSSEDYRRVLRHKWCYARRKRSTGYAEANIKIEGQWTRVLLHRFIMQPGSGMQVDHKDGNGLNCARGNLRLAKHGQNMHNSRSRRGTSRFPEIPEPEEKPKK